MANEDDELEEFLGIPRKTPKFDPNAGTNTGGDVGKLEQPTVNGTSDKRYTNPSINPNFRVPSFFHYLIIGHILVQKSKFELKILIDGVKINSKSNISIFKRII